MLINQVFRLPAPNFKRAIMCQSLTLGREREVVLERAIGFEVAVCLSSHPFTSRKGTSCSQKQANNIEVNLKCFSGTQEAQYQPE